MRCLTETLNQLAKNSLKVTPIAIHCSSHPAKRNVTSMRSITSSVARLCPSPWFLPVNRTLSMSENDRIQPRALASSFLIRSLKALCAP